MRFAKNHTSISFPPRCFPVACLSVAVWLAITAAAPAAVYHLYPPDLTPVLTMQPGDTYILHAGTYNRVYTGTAWNGKGGSVAGGWVTIKGADGEVRPLINYTGGNNVFEMPNVQYLKMQNLEINGGSATFKFQGTCHDIILDNIYMHDVSNSLVNASAIYEMYNLTVSNCEIARSSYSSTGEAFYLGGHEKTYQPQVHDSLIERNYIHDVVEGIEIKAGCTNITVRDNVINANRGTPSMTIYGTYKTDNNLRYRIYRNLIFGSSDAAIQCTSDAEITNNIFVNSLYRGISIRARNLDGEMQNITVANNTFFGAGDACLSISNGDRAINVVVANNAIYQTSPSGIAFNAPNGIDGITLAGNIYYGTSNATSPGLVEGDAPADVFLNASTILGQMNLYPKAGAMLLDAADSLYVPASDFNYLLRPRGSASDVGAYERYYAGNSGWLPATGFRTQLGVAGDADLNGHVNVGDLQLLVAAWTSTPGGAAWNRQADFDNNQQINANDLQMLVTNWNLY